MVNVEINGYPCNIPVGAAEAQSAAGYTGFGAGKHTSVLLSNPGIVPVARADRFPEPIRLE